MEMVLFTAKMAFCRPNGMGVSRERMMILKACGDLDNKRSMEDTKEFVSISQLESKDQNGNENFSLVRICSS